jgi:hypothetical protein
MSKPPATARGLLPFRRTVVARREITVSFDDVERIGRTNLTHVVKVASPAPTEPIGYELLAGMHMHRWFRRVRVPVVVEIESARNWGYGTIAHLRWHAMQHPRLFPLMEADLIAHPISAQRSELVIAGTYQPPFGFLGLLGDLLIGRWVAQSTAETFLYGLGQAIEADVASGHHQRVTAMAVKEA